MSDGSKARRPRPPGLPPIKAAGRRLAHFGDYALNDSLYGIALAVALGFKWIDLNFQVTKDGWIVCTHWSQPMLHGWFDPKGLLDPHRKVWQMTRAEVQRLRYRDDKRLRILTAGVILRAAARQGINVEFEAKDAPQFATAAPWVRLDKATTDIRDRYPHWRHEVKMLTTFRTCLPALHQAYDHGNKTMILPRGDLQVSRKCWPYTQRRRGPVKWVA